MRKKNILYGLYLITITVVALEIILRIFNPFHFRIKGDKIVLDANKQYIFYNSTIPVLEDTIVYTVNSLGFRGPEKKDNGIKQLPLITIGGSTTNCNYLSDSLTWSNKLYNQLGGRFNIWLNNAGLPGHSTFGHLLLLKDYIIKLKPAVVLFLIGCNDVERDDLNASDKSNMTGKYKTVFTFLSKKSELCNTIANLLRSRRAKIKSLSDTYIDLKGRINDTLALSDQVIEARLKKQSTYLEGYKNRVNELVRICKDNNIRPVLVTQPSLFGIGRDGLSGANLELFRISEGMNGLLWWKMQELYNDVTRQVATEQGVLLIDLAKEMPKSSAYFYDIVHFTNAGTGKVSDILYCQLRPWLEKQFEIFLRKPIKDKIGN